MRFISIIIIIPLLISMKEYLTRQPSSKLRFISNENSLTFFQKQNGVLSVSNYLKLSDIYKGPPHTHYNIFATPYQKFFLVEIDPFFVNGFNIQSNKFIFKMNRTGNNFTPVTLGQSPKLHLEDTWISSYNMQNKTISLHKSDLKTHLFIAIKNSVNPYFIPEVIVYKDRDILYTDINQEGRSALILLNRQSKTLTPLLKTQSPGVKIEICLHDDQLYVGQFSIGDVTWGSSISTLNLEKTKDFKHLKELYRSKKADIGNLVCHLHPSKVFFVQNQTDVTDITLVKSEVVSVDLKSKKIETLSDARYGTRVVATSDKLLLDYNNKLYIIYKRPKK
ncbi:hypothetical protein OAB57_00760 [Bacteriovoracaceae bacterium]|nr:hypothetical protein [Bacteriovoracaceae bacterium]